MIRTIEQRKYRSLDMLMTSRARKQQESKRGRQLFETRTSTHEDTVALRPLDKQQMKVRGHWQVCLPKLAQQGWVHEHCRPSGSHEGAGRWRASKLTSTRGGAGCAPTQLKQATPMNWVPVWPIAVRKKLAERGVFRAKGEDVNR